MKKPKHTTSTGALPNSAGFPGRNMVCREGIIVNDRFFRGGILNSVNVPKNIVVQRGEERNNDHKYWQ